MIRVAVTTDRFEEVVGDYSEVGLEPVALPCIQIRPASAALMSRVREDVSRADIVLVTSPRVVTLLWPDGGMPDVEAAVVGPATAAAVSNAGGLVGVVGDGGVARLVELIGKRLRDRRVVIARASGSDRVAMRRAQRDASHLVEHVVYWTMPIPPDQAPVDAVAFASPSAVTGWCLSRGLGDVVVGAIGATTAGAISRHQEPDVIADTPSHSALATAIATFMEVKV